jgi:hypothetical protein
MDKNRIGGTWVFNVGRQIGPQPSFVILDLEAMSERWISVDEDVTRDLTAPAASVAGA